MIITIYACCLEQDLVIIQFLSLGSRQQHLRWPHWPFTHPSLLSPASCPSFLQRVLVSQHAPVPIDGLSHCHSPRCWMKSRGKGKAVIASAGYRRILPKKGRANISTDKYILHSYLHTACLKNPTFQSRVQMISPSLYCTHCLIIPQIHD